MTKPIASLIRSELDWMKEARRDFGELLVDPFTIAVSRNNPALKRIFAESGLDKKDPDHWRLLLAAVTDIVYRPSKPGPGRPVKWTTQLNHRLLRDAYDRRLNDPNESNENIAVNLAGAVAWKGHWVDRERLQRLLKDVKNKQRSNLAKISDQRKYRLGARSQLMRDIAWAFSKEGKIELKRRAALKSRD